MIRRIHLFALFAASLLIGSAATLSAQETEPQAPDNDAILKDIMNGQSSNYYPSLFMRYMAWQPEYEPFDKPEVKDKLLLLVAQTKDSLTLENAEQIVDYANEVMRFDPFSPGNLNFLIYGYGAIGNKVQEQINYHRLQMIAKTIMSSGTGLKETSPWHVLTFAHATDMMAYLGQDYGTRRVVSRTTEYVPLLVRQPGGVKGYYFNFERMYWRRPEKMPQKKPTGWEFNGIPIKKRITPVH